ncbi:efflux RND transporter periplasmic adaptor subunit [Microvirga sp. VF16]|uniref:efflux RND transporter periplasmic adaptor subunit n=1 Tax=Microvirga sp. VF16 TaxID=2807101 RepID=UPI00193CCEC7|nr:efflux RND transporter periplasmic adaptor subunit [Microvirga sp. VF16]QRM31377.1 efflux RND transporter periplasmic adaptor subunit [Microvirga sp. VF16]
MTRIFLLAVLIVAGVLLPARDLVPEGAMPSVLSGMRGSMPPAPGGRELSAYRTVPTERGDLISAVTAGGTLNAVVLVEVGSQVSGQVSELFVDFNSAVTQGQVIARISPEIYEARMAQAQAELKTVRAGLPVHQAEVERVRAELDNAKSALAVAKAQTVRAELAADDAKRDLDRKQSLAERAIVSASDWERVQSAHRSAQAQLAASRAQELSQASAIRAAEAAARMAEAQLVAAAVQVTQKEAILRQAQIDLERTFIRAPVTGTVVNRSVNRGQTVAASLQAPTLFTIAQDLRQMQVEASVVEADVSRFAIGQPVTFTVDAHPGRSFTGTVQQIRKAPQTVQNVVTYTAVIATENPDEALLPGMTANLQVVVGRKTDVLKVPNTALRYRPPESAPETMAQGAVASPAGAAPHQPGTPGQVFVLGPEGQPTPVPLRLGISDGRMTEVLAGDLDVGQAVVVGRASASPAAASPLATFRLW